MKGVRGLFSFTRADFRTPERVHCCTCRCVTTLPYLPDLPSHSVSSRSISSDRSTPSSSSSSLLLASRLMFRRIRIVMLVHSGSDLLPLWWPVRGGWVEEGEMSGFGLEGVLLVFLRRLRVPANLLSDMGKRLLSNCPVCLPASFCPGVIENF